MKEISAIHLERANEFLADSRNLLATNGFSSSISRSYYAAFHGAKAVLAELGMERKSHQAVWSAFGQSVAKAGLMDRKYHEWGLRLFFSRQDSDYLPRPADTLEDAQKAHAIANEFVISCRAFLEKRPSGT